MTESVEHIVRKFYESIWNSKQFDIAHEILHPELIFRGSLGAEINGVEGFLGYVRDVHGALSNYTCTINTLISDADNVAAKMTFSGTHTGVLLGIEPTGRRVVWDGAAFFSLRAGKVERIWVLGDVDSIKQQIEIE